MKELRYAARMWEDETGDVCVELPKVGGAGMATHGSNWEDAREMAQDLIDGYLTICLRDDEDPMEPQQRLPHGEGWEWVYPAAKVSMCWQIRRARREQGLTQKQVAGMLGVTQEAYTRWENPDKMNAKLETLEKLAKVFGTRLQVSLQSEGRREAALTR